MLDLWNAIMEGVLIVAVLVLLCVVAATGLRDEEVVRLNGQIATRDAIVATFQARVSELESGRQGMEVKP